MESKKVKEIKDCLQNCINDCGATSCPYDKYEKGLKCIEDLQKDCLTLINELESEKERLSKELDSEWKDRRKAEEDLRKAQWNYKIGLAQSQKRNKELKDRIAELEKENEILQGTKDRLTFADRINIVNNAVEIKLKQFAERLKEKATRFTIYEAVKINAIDETLKEFIKQ
jgi:septal ring factor EnvC (AmiA/AmiB activator)